MARREHALIVGDILEAIHEQAAEPHLRGGVSRLASTVNVAYDRLLAYLSQLERLHLVANGTGLALTSDGEQLLASYHEWHRALERFGLQGVEPPVVVA